MQVDRKTPKLRSDSKVLATITGCAAKLHGFKISFLAILATVIKNQFFENEVTF